MRKIAAVIGASAVLAVVPFATTQAQDAPSVVRVVHGIGDSPNPVDVYIGAGSAPAQWDLAIEDLAFEEVAEVGNVPAGDYNVLLCDATQNPPATITSCPPLESDQPEGRAAVNGNSGTPITLDPGVQTEVVAAWGGPGSPVVGRPTVVAYDLDTSCVDGATPARITAVHAAVAPEVDVTADSADLFTNLAFGNSDAADVPAATYSVGVELASDGTEVIAPFDADLQAQTNTVAIVVGFPEEQIAPMVIVDSIPLDECAVPVTTTSTAAPTTTTTFPARPAAAQPRFTG